MMWYVWLTKCLALVPFGVGAMKHSNFKMHVVPVSDVDTFQTLHDMYQVIETYKDSHYHLHSFFMFVYMSDSSIIHIRLLDLLSIDDEQIS